MPKGKLKRTYQKMTKPKNELADKHIVIKPSTKKRLKIWMAQNDQDILAL